MSAAKDGKAFSITTGRPVEWGRDKPKEQGPPPVTWYSLTLDCAKAKWKFASPNQRRSIAEALTDATEVLFVTESPYPRAEVRRALTAWACSAPLLGETRPPEDNCGRFFCVYNPQIILEVAENAFRMLG